MGSNQTRRRQSRRHRRRRIGNEIVKNLALLGIGNIFIADKDRIENSNLSRSVLYRESDAGEFKATVAARAAKEIYPHMNVACFNGNIVHDLGLGVFHWADLVIGGLDNREARLSINRACWKVNRPWIDGAIEQIQGVARVFVPDADQPRLLRMHHVPTRLATPPTPPQLQSAHPRRNGTRQNPHHPHHQLHHRRRPMPGSREAPPRHGNHRGQRLGLPGTKRRHLPNRIPTQTTTATATTRWTKSSHSTPPTTSMTARDLLNKAAHDLGGAPCEIELNRDILEKFVCPQCKQEELLYQSLGKVKSDRALCPTCKTVRREVITFNKIRGTEPFLDRKLSEIGIPPFDIVTIRANNRSIGLEFSADNTTVLGSLAGRQD